MGEAVNLSLKIQNHPDHCSFTAASGSFACRNSEGKLEADEVLTDCIEAALVQADLRPDQVKGMPRTLCTPN